MLFKPTSSICDVLYLPIKQYFTHLIYTVMETLFITINNGFVFTHIQDAGILRFPSGFKYEAVTNSYKSQV